MKHPRWIRRAAMAGLIAATLLVAGCGFNMNQDLAGSIDPPQVDYEDELDMVWKDSLMEETMAGLGAEAPVTLYFRDPDGFVTPLGLRIPAEEGIARLSLQYMVEGGPGEAYLPDGFSALLPKGTEIHGIDIRDGLAIVDFSEAFTDYNPQDERKILEAITWTLTGFPTIDRVQLWVEGRPLKEMPVDGTPVEPYLTRAMGINLEMEQGLNPALASSVTLYFKNRNAQDFAYFVPVTRLIRHTEDLTEALVRELIEGPSANSALYAVLDPETMVHDVVMTDSTVAINLGDNMPVIDGKVSGDALQALVLSLAEQTGRNVQILVNGESGFAASDNVNYSVPVGRPSLVNPMGL